MAFWFRRESSKQIWKMAAILDFWSELFLLFLIYMLPLYFLPSFGSVGFSIQKKFKTDFQNGSHGSHPGFLIGMMLAIFDPQVTPIFHIKFRVNWPFGSEVQNRASKWWPWWPSWISYCNDVSYFWSTGLPNTYYQFSSQLAFWFRRISLK